MDAMDSNSWVEEEMGQMLGREIQREVDKPDLTQEIP